MIKYDIFIKYTVFSEQLSPENLVKILNTIFTEFDRFVEKYSLEKIKTIGDAYMVVAGLPEHRADHAEVMAEMALDMMNALERINFKLDRNLNIRIGLNSGPVIAGVIGQKKFAYDLWGDSVNIAALMESDGVPGEIQVTQAFYDLIKSKYDFEERGEVSIKGKGLMKTYFLKGRKSTFHVEQAAAKKK